MNRLFAELQRLYFLPAQHWPAQPPEDGAAAACLIGETALQLVSAEASVRAMVIDFSRARDWEPLAGLYQALQQELDLPAPAVSVSGQGYGLWLSLAAPVPVASAREFLEALRRKYLAEIPADHLGFHPAPAQPAAVAPSALRLAPALQRATGKWSAFIDASLGGMFIAEPWLEMAPNPDRQAELLARLESIKSGSFARALSLLQAAVEAEGSPRPAAEAPPPNPPDAAADPAAPPAGRIVSALAVGQHYRDPQSFLLAVMNDPSASARLRVEAAKALLPCFPRGAPEGAAGD